MTDTRKWSQTKVAPRGYYNEDAVIFYAEDRPDLIYEAGGGAHWSAYDDDQSAVVLALLNDGEAYPALVKAAHALIEDCAGHLVSTHKLRALLPATTEADDD